MRQDLRLAFRRLLHDPGFSFTVILILALTIGANIAVLSVVNTALVRPMPYPQPERLGELVVTIPGIAEIDDSHDGETWESVRDLTGVADAAAYGLVTSANLSASGRAVSVRHARVSAGFFHVLGVAPAMGREFDRAEDVPGGPALAILSHPLWLQQFHGDPNIVGQSVLLRGEPSIVIGIMPAGFQYNDRADLWTPLRPSRTGEGGGSNYGILLRLKPGVTIQRASAEMAPLAANLSRFKRDPGAQLRVVSLQEGLVRDLRRPLTLLWAAVALVFVLGCANVSGMILSRTAGRSGEFATCLALGATAGRIAREIIVESLTVALAGGALGFLVGLWSLEAIQSLGSRLYPVLQTVKPDWLVAGVAIGLSVLAGAIAPLVPVWMAVREGLRAERLSGRGLANRSLAGTSRLLPLGGLVAGQLALTVPLLAGSGLLLHSLLKLSSLDPGMSPEHILTASFSLQDARYNTSAKANRLFDQVLAELRGTPGIEAATVGIHLPYERWMNIGMASPRPDARRGTEIGVNINYVAPGYFETLRIPMLRGRTFSAMDTAEAQHVAVVNQAFVKRYLAGMEPMGVLLPSLKATIIGVVGNLEQRPGFNYLEVIQQAPAVYVPAAQTRDELLQSFHTWFSPKWIVRSPLAEAQVRRLIEEAVSSADPLLPIGEFQTIYDLKWAAVSFQRFLAVLVSAIGALATILAALGIYGLLANLTAVRRREFGIRLALGGSLGHVLREAALPAVRWAAAGALAGCGLAWACERLIVKVIWGIKTTDPWTIVAVAVSLIGAAALAGLPSCLRLARLNPAEALREE